MPAYIIADVKVRDTEQYKAYAALSPAAVAAAAVLYREGHDCSVISFAKEAVVVKAQDAKQCVWFLIVLHL